MANFDVFNGDADGICALHQLRMAEPRDSVLVTGVKRDIALLTRVVAGAGDRVTVLDISLDSNRDGLLSLLERGAEVSYFDHHFSGEIPRHPNLRAMIDTAHEVCTSVLVDRHLEGRFRAWAVTAAFGDNLGGTAVRLAEPLSLSKAELDILRELGECLNYNAYGETVADLHFAPDVLYRRLSEWRDPFAFVADSSEFAKLKSGYEEDMSAVSALRALEESETAAVILLPPEKWARRVSGVYANQLAEENPGRAHALITAKEQGGYVVSVRAPLMRPDGADSLCRRFETGGGRKGAAGINHLPSGSLDAFLQAFRQAF